jgi:hypothetical protein
METSALLGNARGVPAPLDDDPVWGVVVAEEGNQRGPRPDLRLVCITGFGELDGNLPRCPPGSLDDERPREVSIRTGTWVGAPIFHDPPACHGQGVLPI